MSLPLIFHPAVRDEINGAYRWHEGQQQGLGDDFLKMIEEAFAKIVASPKSFAVVHADIREIPTRRFQYAVYYRVLSDQIRIVAVYHNRRDPSGWQRRI